MKTFEISVEIDEVWQFVGYFDAVNEFTAIEIARQKNPKFVDNLWKAVKL
ncbi:MAG: hypothetical protein WBP41_09890 [Saprospiraceae bacterium]